MPFQSRERKTVAAVEIETVVASGVVCPIRKVLRKLDLLTLGKLQELQPSGQAARSPSSLLFKLAKTIFSAGARVSSKATT